MVVVVTDDAIGKGQFLALLRMSSVRPPLADVEELLESHPG